MNVSGATGAAALTPEQLVAWVSDDVSSYRTASAREVAGLHTLLAANNSAHAPYLETLRSIEPDLAATIEAESELMSLARVIGNSANLRPDAVAEGLAQAAPATRATLGDTARMQALEAQIDARLHWLPSVQIKDAHAAIAAALGRADADMRRQIADEARAAFARERETFAQHDPARLQRQTQDVADFIAANRGLLTWKVNENIANANNDLKAVFADEVRMRELDPYVDARLDGISPLFVHDLQSVIAAQMGRADSDQRARKAAHLHQESDPGPPGSQPARASPGAPSSASTEPVGQRGDPPAAARIDAVSHDQAPLAAVAAAAGGPALRPTDEHSNEQAAPGPYPDPATAPPRRSPRNGFASGEAPAAYAPVASLDKLLERMAFKAHKDGSVLYLIDDQPAFVDHGHQLLMVGAADQQEQAILAAIVVAKEKFGGAFEITGDAEFCRRAIAVMLKYEMDVRLKNPEQEAIRRELARAQEQRSHRLATPAGPVAPIDPASLRHHATRVTDAAGGSGASADATVMKPAPGTTARGSAARGTAAIPTAAADPIAPSPSTAPALSEPVNRLAGKVLAHGHAPFNHVPGNSESYFVELENADGLTRTTWGIDLARAVSKAGVANGDQVVLQNLGKKAVDIRQSVAGTGGEASTTPIKAHRVIWDIEVVPRVGMQKGQGQTQPEDAGKPVQAPSIARDRPKRASGSQKTAVPARESAPDPTLPAAAATLVKPKAPRQRQARMAG